MNLGKDKYEVEDEKKEMDKSGNCFSSIDSCFKATFHKLGVTIGKHPWYFVIVPIFVCLGLTAGLCRFSYINDPEYLFAPNQGQGQDARRLVEHYFPSNFTNRFNPSRLLKPSRAARTFVTALDGGSLLRDNIFQEMKELDEIVQNASFFYNKKKWSYDNLCAKWEGECYKSDILELADSMKEIEAGNKTLSYPIMFNPSTFKTYIFPLYFGDVQLVNESNLESVKVYGSWYFVNIDTPADEMRGEEWEGAVLNALDDADPHWKFIKVFRITWRTCAEEMDQNVLLSIPFMAITLPFMIMFAAGTMMSKDWVRAKPWLGVVGICSTVLGTMAGFGVVCFFGVPLISIHITIPFLMLGIGIDDGFVMLAAWRQTSYRNPVPKRMGEAFAEAAVSITITSLTDALSFWVGLAAPFNSVRIFCWYAGASIIGTYLCHVLIFGGALAIAGYHEAKNKHGLFLWKKAITKSKLDPKKSWWYRNLFVGGNDPNDPFNPIDHREHSLMIFFRDSWAYYVNKSIVKALVIVFFAVYLAVAGWGISKTEEGLQLSKLVRYGSYAEKYFEVENEHFRKYPYRIQVVLTGDMDYHNETTQVRIEKMMKELEQSQYVGHGSLLGESWLRSFVRYAKRLKDADLELNMTTEATFIQSLQENYLGPSSIYSEDVKFNEDNTKIIASRFIIQTVNVTDSNDDIRMLSTLRAIVDSQEPKINVTLYNPYFLLFDQYLLIRSTTVQCVVITGLVMMIVSLLLIPNPLCSLWVAFSIMSIEVGVLGFLALWNVNLDGISMICLIMCIGFSVDFSAHISYAYISAKADSPDERVKACLYSLGIPIAQGAMSTILGVFTLAIAPSYALNTFAKSVILVMIIAAAHGLLLLPVLLSLFGPGSCNSRDKEKEKYLEGKYTKQGLDNVVYVADIKVPQAKEN